MNELNADQSHRTAAADPGLNVALEASAGTGKTRVLVNRYVRLVEEGADPRHILAITFTRKAAGEMKNRILGELRERVSLWKEIRESLFDIHITTIDAFCLGLLREFPLEAGLDPDIELLDEVDADHLLEESVDGVLQSKETHGTNQLGFLVSVFGEPALRRGIRDFLRSRLIKKETLSRFVRRSIDPNLELDEALRRAAQGLNNRLRGETGLRELLECAPDPSFPIRNALAFALGRAIDPDRASALDIEQVADYFMTQERLPRKKLAPIFTKKDFQNQDDYEHHRDLVLARAPDVAEAYRRWTSDRDRVAVRELWKLYNAALYRFTRLKKERHGLDFTDVLLEAVELLEKRGEFSQSRFRLESRYHHILVDEFQDTNKRQWDLVEALIESWGEGAGLVQEAILAEQASGRGQGKITEPTIFIVGDRKQSIYGWRDARVEVLETASHYIERLMPGRGRRLRISRSFRARGDLLEFMNDVFTEMPKAPGELDWTFRYREGDRFPASETEPSSRPIGLAVAADLATAAAAVADEIVRLLLEENLQPKDVVILFRSRTHYRIYEKALAERGVPTYVYRGLGFFDSPEVRDIRALVRFLADPGSELRAAELARSRFVRSSDTALALLASLGTARNKDGPLVRWLTGRLSDNELPSDLSPNDRTIVKRASENVPDWLEIVDRVPPVDLIQQIIEDTDYAVWFADAKSGAQGWENLKKILEMIRRAQNRGYLTLARLAEYLERASAGDESLAVLEAVNAVSLMSIHAAKGLEFEAAFVVNLDQKTRSDTSLPRITELAGEDVIAHALGRVESEGPDRAVEEEKRLLYVAMTRARRNLVLSASKLEETEGVSTLFRLLPESLRDCFRIALTTDKRSIVWNPAATPHHMRVLRPHEEPLRYRTGEIDMEYFLDLEPLPTGSPRRTTVGAHVQEISGEPFNPWALDPLELAVGMTVHRLFEYQVAPDGELVEAAAAVLPDTPGRSPSERRTAAQKAADFYTRLSSQTKLQEVFAKGQTFREVPFSLTRGDQTLRGVVDSLVVRPDRVTVVDYKTGRSRPEHRLQMEIYLEAVVALYPDRAVEGMIFYPRGVPQRIHLPKSGAGSPDQLNLFSERK